MGNMTLGRDEYMCLYYDCVSVLKATKQVSGKSQIWPIARPKHFK